jgi:hypothetical protein
MAYIGTVLLNLFLPVLIARTGLTVSLKHCVRSSVDTGNEKTAPLIENLLTANRSMSDGLTSLLTPCYATFFKYVIVCHKKFPLLSGPRTLVR